MPSLYKFIIPKWRRLTSHSGSKRLSLFALLLVFALDAIVLSLVFKGTDDVQQLVNGPQNHLSNACLQLSAGLLQSETDEHIPTFAWFAEQLAEDEERTIAHFNGEADKLFPTCIQIREKLLKTFSAPHLRSLFNERRRINKEMEKIDADIDRLKNSYSEALLEKIADQKRSESILPVEAGKIKTVLETMKTELSQRDLRRKEILATLETHPALANYLAYLKTPPIYDDLAAEQARFNRLLMWYPVEVMAAQVAFIVPLLLLAIFWNARAIKSNRETQIMISSHLILVASIPIALRIVFLVRHVIPDQLLDMVLNILRQWKLSFLWYYFVIFASVGAGLFLIFIAQRALFTPVRQRLVRLRKALCRECGEKLGSREQACCELCGAQQLAPCKHCGNPRKLLAFHCQHCGVGRANT